MAKKKTKKQSKNKVAPDLSKVRVVKGRNGGVLYAAKKGYTPNPNGRKRKYVSTLAEEHGYTAMEVRDAMRALLSMSIEELKKVKVNTEATVLERTVASALITSFQRGNLTNLEIVISRPFGHATKAVEIGDKNGKPLALNVTVLNEGPKLSSSEKEVEDNLNPNK